MAMPRPNTKATKIAKKILGKLGDDVPVAKNPNKKDKKLSNDLPLTGARERGTMRTDGPYG